MSEPEERMRRLVESQPYTARPGFHGPLKPDSYTEGVINTLRGIKKHPVGEFFVGDADRALENLSTGFPVTKGAGWTTQLTPEGLDLAFLQMDMAGAPIGSDLLAKALRGKIKRGGKPDLSNVTLSSEFDPSRREALKKIGKGVGTAAAASTVGVGGMEAMKKLAPQVADAAKSTVKAGAKTAMKQAPKIGTLGKTVATKLAKGLAEYYRFPKGLTPEQFADDFVKQLPAGTLEDDYGASFQYLAEKFGDEVDWEGLPDRMAAKWHVLSDNSPGGLQSVSGDWTAKQMSTADGEAALTEAFERWLATGKADKEFMKNFNMDEYFRLVDEPGGGQFSYLSSDMEDWLMSKGAKPNHTYPGPGNNFNPVKGVDF
jgi:hypothetical protein